MENVNFGKMSFSVAKPGVKPSNATRPELVLAPTFNKFNLNSLASSLMKVQNGDYVTIITNDEAADVNSMYFIAKGIGEEAQAKLASVGKAPGYGKSLSFNYSGLYSKMLQTKVDAQEISAEGLNELGLVEKRETEGGSESFVALKKIHFELGEPFEVEIDGMETTLYPLINMKEVAYTPRNIGGTEEEEE